MLPLDVIILILSKVKEPKDYVNLSLARKKIYEASRKPNMLQRFIVQKKRREECYIMSYFENIITRKKEGKKEYRYKTTLCKSETYVNDELDGEMRWYDPIGNLTHIENYKRNKRIGLAIYYKPGNVTRVIENFEGFMMRDFTWEVNHPDKVSEKDYQYALKMTSGIEQPNDI